MFASEVISHVQSLVLTKYIYSTIFPFLAYSDPACLPPPPLLLNCRTHAYLGLDKRKKKVEPCSKKWNKLRCNFN